MDKWDLTALLFLGFMFIVFLVLAIKGPVKLIKSEDLASESSSTWEEWKGDDSEPSVLRGLCLKAGESRRRTEEEFPAFPKDFQVPSQKEEGDSLGETCCVKFMRALYPNSLFIKDRPRWLKNPKTGFCLELDGYCRDKSLAVEYNGEQHYNWNHYYNNYSKKKYEEQRERDETKVKICKRQGVKLIVVPYTVPLEKIPYYIYACLLDYQQ